MTQVSQLIALSATSAVVALTLACGGGGKPTTTTGRTPTTAMASTTKSPPQDSKLVTVPVSPLATCTDATARISSTVVAAAIQISVGGQRQPARSSTETERADLASALVGIIGDVCPRWSAQQRTCFAEASTVEALDLCAAQLPQAERDQLTVALAEAAQRAGLKP